MSTDDYDGLSLAERFRMASEGVSDRCLMACKHIKAVTYDWFGKRYNATPDQLDSPESSINALRFQHHDWLPVLSESELNPTDVSRCFGRVEGDFLRFRKALDQACLREVGDDDEVGKSRRTAFMDSRALVNNILDDLAIMRDRLDLPAPDVSSEIGKIDSIFKNPPPLQNDRDDWEYLILKQLMEYLHFCNGLFGRLKLNNHDEF